jgi:acyl transferase domain-containing protein
MSYSGFLGSEGKSFTFDHRADGYARGEGVATVLMKPLAAALKDGDTIRAVIRSTGLNHDGHTPGMTYPSMNSQEQLIRNTYQAAGLSLDHTLYTESHGTGTQAGDYVECEAISRAFSTETRANPLHVGTLKPNIGHLEGGAGVAGVVKMILLLEHGVIPPNVNFDQVNPKILSKWNIQFPKRCIPWPSTGLRRTSISSFGLSGTNAHCILDDAYHYLKVRGLCGHHQTRATVPTTAELENEISILRVITETDHREDNNTQLPLHDRDHGGTTPTLVLEGNGVLNASHGHSLQAVPMLFILSAFDQKGLQRVLSNMQAYIRSRKTALNNFKTLSDLAYTLAERRSRFSCASYILCSSVQELDQKLSEASIPLANTRAPPRLTFIFSGQGAQYAGMGKQLLVYTQFRQSLEQAGAYFNSLGCEWSLLGRLYWPLYAS